MSAKGVLFSMASRKQDFGGLLAIPKAHIAVWAQRRHERSFSTTVDKSPSHKRSGRRITPDRPVFQDSQCQAVRLTISRQTPCGLAVIF